MLCNFCGHNNHDGVRFCAKCGTPMDTAPAAEPVDTYDTPDKSTQEIPADPFEDIPSAPIRRRAAGFALPKIGPKLRRMLPVAALGIIVAIVLILLFSAAGGSKAVANKALKRVANGKILAYSKLYHKDYLDSEDMLDKKAQKKLKELDEAWEAAVEEFEEEEGGNLRFDYKIKDVDPIKGKELEAIRDEYADNYDLKVKKAKHYEMEINTKWDDEEEEFEVHVEVIKIGGKWYLYSCENPILGLLYEYMDTELLLELMS